MRLGIPCVSDRCQGQNLPPLGSGASWSLDLLGERILPEARLCSSPASRMRWLPRMPESLGAQKCLLRKSSHGSFLLPLWPSAENVKDCEEEGKVSCDEKALPATGLLPLSLSTEFQNPRLGKNIRGCQPLPRLH